MLVVDELGKLTELDDTEDFELKNLKYELKVHFLLNPLDEAELDFFKYQLDDDTVLPFLINALKEKMQQMLHFDLIGKLKEEELVNLFDPTRLELYNLYLKLFKENDDEQSYV